MVAKISCRQKPTREDMKRYRRMFNAFYKKYISVYKKYKKTGDATELERLDNNGWKAVNLSVSMYYCKSRGRAGMFANYVYVYAFLHPEHKWRENDPVFIDARKYASQSDDIGGRTYRRIEEYFHKKKNMLGGEQKQGLRLRWRKGRGHALTDAGAKSGTVYTAQYKGYTIEVFPMRLYKKDKKGWQARIRNKERNIDYYVFSFERTPHTYVRADTAKEAMGSATLVLENFLRDER